MILGLDLSGEVVAIGDKVTRFKVGDLVYADSGTLPGGAYAEYAAVAEAAAAPKPTHMSHAEAAAVPVAGLTALQALRDLGHLQPGQHVLINGAAGGVGSFAIQIAKALGAEVTAVGSTKNFELLKALGANHLIDYSQQDFTQGAAQYDIVFDAVSKRSFGECKKVLKPKGIYIRTLPSPDVIVQGILTSLLPGQKAKLIFVQAKGSDLAYLKDLVEQGKLRSLIDRTYSLSEIAAAHAQSETERSAGKLVITCEEVE
jgi:NADPH:quinone reductase-like Zn-dependent oxidoreductase